MCGLVLSFTPRAPTRAAVVASMCNALRHRGPDDEGYLAWSADGGARLLAGADTPESVLRAETPWQPRGALIDAPDLAVPLLMGHRRLAIVDLSPWGHQPMRRASAHIVFNGEIYNHIELRAELESLGHAFAGHSDTEVLLAAVAQWGPDALSRCNGMWAFVLFDEARRRLLIARDRFGVKPLYLWQGDGGALLAASEIKALLVHPLVRAAARLDACVRFARHGPAAWQAETEFAGITRFPAGHWAELDLDDPRALAPRPYWAAPAPANDPAAFEPRRAAQLSEAYRALLGDAVRLRLRADVRVGTALSGGLDSSSIAWLVNQQLRSKGAQERQEVFSSVYRQPELAEADESAFIERVGTQLLVRSNVIEPAAADVPHAHERMIWALDTPPLNTLMSSWHTFALVARRGVVVTLDGQGADEQLAGYSRYVRNLLVHAPAAAAWREARALLTGLQGFGSAVAIGLAARLVRSVGGRRALAALVRRTGAGADPSPRLADALANDFSTHLCNLLLYADKTAMAWSVESRMPFMDYRIVEFLAQVPTAYKIHGGWTKWLARDAFDSRLPKEVTWRRDKMGWAIPESPWFATRGAPLGAWLDDALRNSAFAREVAQAGAIRPEAAGLPQRLRLLNLAAWHRLFFEETGRPGRALGRGMPLGSLV